MGRPVVDVSEAKIGGVFTATLPDSRYTFSFRLTPEHLADDIAAAAELAELEIEAGLLEEYDCFFLACIGDALCELLLASCGDQVPAAPCDVIRAGPD